MNKNQTEQQVAQKVTFIGGLLDALLGSIKIFAASLSGSQALMADGIHSLSDLLTDIVVWFSFTISRQSPDKNHPFGHLRFESLANLILGLVLFFVAIAIAYDAIFHTSQSQLTWLGIASLVSTIVFKELIFFYTKRAGDAIKSQLLITNAWHSRTDSLSSLIVLFSMLGVYLGFAWLDKLAAILVGLLIAKIALSTIWKTLAELIDTAPSKEVMQNIIKSASSFEPQANAHKIRARTMAGKIYLDMHLQVDDHISTSESHFLAEKVRQKIRQFNPNVSDIHIQIDLKTLDKEASQQIAKLPDRNQIQADFQFLLRQHKDYLDIKNIQLDYLASGLHITLTAYAKALNEEQSMDKICQAIDLDCGHIHYAKNVSVRWELLQNMPTDIHG